MAQEDKRELDSQGNSKERKEKKGILTRVRTRLDRYREQGRARRERLEERLQRNIPITRRGGGEGSKPAFSVLPGTARPPLSANDFHELERLTGYVIKHRAYFMQALTHRSYLQFAPDENLSSNERLEFLGDSVLNLIVAEYLYREFKSQPEGELTKLRSRLVSGVALVKHAMDIGLQNFLLLSTSAENALKRGSATLLADSYESLIAAIYLDGGMDAARDFVYRHIITHARRDELMLSDHNYKSMLLEYVQSKKLSSPRYVTVNEEGPNHARLFSVEVLVETVSRGAGMGRSKKEAEQNAAREALVHYGLLEAEADPTEMPN